MKKIKVEVAYAAIDKQRLLMLEVDEGMTLKEVILQSQIMTIFPEIDLEKQKIGVFGKRRELTDSINEGDRIEIYRPLTIDPKLARRAKSRQSKR